MYLFYCVGFTFNQVNIQGVVGGALAPPAPSSAPLEKPLTQRMKRCDLVPAPFKNLHIPDFPPCMQILYETLNRDYRLFVT